MKADLKLIIAIILFCCSLIFFIKYGTNYKEHKQNFKNNQIAKKEILGDGLSKVTLKDNTICIIYKYGGVYCDFNN